MLHSEEFIFQQVMTSLGESCSADGSLPNFGFQSSADVPQLSSTILPLVINTFLKAATEILQEADPLSHGMARRIPGEIIPDGPDSGTLPLPHDFMKLAAFRMCGWNRTIHDFSPPGSLRVRLAANRFPRMWHPFHPLLILEGNEAGRQIHLYGADMSNTRPEIATYVPVPRLRHDHTILFPESLLGSAVELTATRIRKSFLYLSET
ncbi:MAG: hypothetical protein K2N03_04245 [Muribaculaceae bacterium]|nr:hypothetical protein [Muribaculaceae bacterium]